MEHQMIKKQRKTKGKKSMPYCLNTITTSKKVAFTLAEVLITLGIIGVVAALTMPSLVAKYEKQRTVTQLKKAYSEIAQSLKLAEVEHGAMTEWYGNWPDTVGSEWLNNNKDFLENYLGKNIKFVKTCVPTSEECWKVSEDISSDHVFGNLYKQKFVSALTASGYSIYCWVGGDNNYIGNHAQIFIDVDGPNRGKQALGKDIFRMIYFFKTGKESIATSTINRDQAFENCEQYGDCLKLIMLDNWKISQNYPRWK